MTAISASLVKELREKTGAGMMDCKKALTENDGDMEAAIDWLRKKGLSKAAKKADRVAAEGLVGVSADGKTGAVVEINSETDFVARNDQFQGMVREITSLAMGVEGDLEKLLATKVESSGKAVVDHVKDMVATIGENMNVRRTGALSVEDGVVSGYVHNKSADGMGKIGVLVALESSGDKEKLSELGRQIAMHVAAASPLALTEEELDSAVIERERAIFTEQALAAGTKPEFVEKQVEGKLRKQFFQQVLLPKQTFVIDGKATVEQAVKDAAKTVGAPVTIKGFLRYGLGEGIEKEEDDFAAEVAAAAGSK